MNLIVCDFDGTLIRKNSFPLWILFIIRKSLLKGNLGLFLFFSTQLIRRKLGMISHAEFKRLLMSRDYPHTYDKEFMQTLAIHLNSKVLEKIIAPDTKALLTSAAPARYLTFANQVLGVYFSEVIGSSIQHGSLFENYSSNKVESLKTIHPEAEHITFFTDHHEDLPLMQHANKVILVNPSSETIARVSAAGIEFEVLD